MRRTLLLTGFLSTLFPIVAYALDVSPEQYYRDVPLGRPEAVSVAVLRRAGLVQISDRFYPTRLVNRAEFMKMVMSWYRMEHENTAGGIWTEACFPDVRLDDWFGPFVCEAFDAGFIGGYPDGLFHPERPVQYDEALKILTTAFGYEIPSIVSSDWGERYYRASAARGTDLARTIRLNTPLSRGLVARLLAAFIAERAQMLDALRFAEAGHLELFSSSSSSSAFSSSAASSVASSVSSVASSSSSSTSASMFTVPPVSHFLLTGVASDAIASVTIPAEATDAFVAVAQVKLANEARALKHLELVREDGTVVATLLRRTTTDLADYKLIYDAQIPEVDQVVLAAGVPHRLVLRAVVRDASDAGFSDDYVLVRSIALSVRTGTTTRSIPALGSFPPHQTAFGRIASITRVADAPAVFPEGSVVAGGFRIQTEGDPTRSFALRQLRFHYTTKDLTVRAWSLRFADFALGTVSCGASTIDQSVSCVIPSTVPSISMGGVLTAELLADVSPVTGGTPSLHVRLHDAGDPTAGGSVRWTDGSGQFSWIESSALDAAVRQ